MPPEPQICLTYDIAQGGEPLLNSLDLDRVWETVPDLLQLLVRGGAGHEEAVSVASRHPAQDPAAGDGSVHHRDHVLQLRLKHAEKGFITLYSIQRCMATHL